MPDPELAVAEPESTEAEPPDSFAARATRITEGKEDEHGNALDKEGNIVTKETKEPEKPAKVETKAKEEPKPDDVRRPPDTLFGDKKKEEKSEDKPAESEIDKIPVPEFKDPKRKAQWDTLHTKARDFEKQAQEAAKKLSEAQARLTELEANGKASEPLQARVAELEKQNAEYLKLVRQVDMTLDPEYRSRFIDGRSKLVKDARTIVEESGGDPKAIETALNLKGKPRIDALTEVADALNAFQSGRLGRVIDALDALDQEADSKRSNPDQYLESRRREQQEQESKQRDEFTRKTGMAFEGSLRKMQSELEVLRQVEGVDWWNQQAKEIPEKARRFYESNDDFGAAAEVAIKAQAMDAYRDFYLKEREHSKKLESDLAERDAELMKLYGNGPTLGGASGINGGKAVQEMSFTERWEHEQTKS